MRALRQVVYFMGCTLVVIAVIRVCMLLPSPYGDLVAFLFGGAMSTLIWVILETNY